jgi:hypothetical protein
MFCVIVIQDKSLSTMDKLAAIGQFEQPPASPPPKTEPPAFDDNATDHVKQRGSSKLTQINGRYNDVQQHGAGNTAIIGGKY